MPTADSGGFGGQDSKIFSEAIIRLYSGDYAGAYGCFDAERWKAEAEVGINPLSANHHAGLALLYAQMGWTKSALAEAGRAVELVPPIDPFAKVWFHFNLARAYAWAAEPDAALKEMELVLNSQWDYKANNFRLDPVWDPIRKDPRFQKWLESKSK